MIYSGLNLKIGDIVRSKNPYFLEGCKVFLGRDEGGWLRFRDINGKYYCGWGGHELFVETDDKSEGCFYKPSKSKIFLVTVGSWVYRNTVFKFRKMLDKRRFQ